MAHDPWLDTYARELEARLVEVERGAETIFAELDSMIADGHERGVSDDAIRNALIISMEVSRHDRPTMAHAIALYAMRGHDRGEATGRNRLVASCLYVRSP